jgi:hypothetical protein
MNDEKECRFIILQGATERLLMLLRYRSDRNYDLGMRAVEEAIKDYRGFRSNFLSKETGANDKG